MKDKKSRRSGSGELPVPLSTLIDVVFLLLIYFIVTWSTPIPEAHLAVNLPSPGKAEGDGDPPQVLQLVVQPDEILLQGSAYPLEEIQSRLARLAELQSDQPVIIKVSMDATTDRLVSVLDMCKGAGFTTLNVMTLTE